MRRTAGVLPSPLSTRGSQRRARHMRGAWWRSTPGSARRAWKPRNRETLPLPKRGSPAHMLMEFASQLRLSPGGGSESVFAEEDCSDVVGFFTPIAGCVAGTISGGSISASNVRFLSTYRHAGTGIKWLHWVESSLQLTSFRRTARQARRDGGCLGPSDEGSPKGGSKAQ